MAINEVLLSDYLTTLNIQTGSKEEHLFNQLLVQDDLLFEEVMNKLIAGGLLLSELLALPSVNYRTLRSLLDSQRTSGELLKLAELKTLMATYDLSGFKVANFPNATSYSGKLGIPSSFYKEVTSVSSNGVSTGKYESYSAVEQAYLALVNNDTVIQDALVTVNNKINTPSPLSSTKFVNLNSSIANISTQLNFIHQAYNPYPEYEAQYNIGFILRGLFSINPISTFDTKINELLTALSKSTSSELVDITVIQSMYNSMHWSEVDVTGGKFKTNFQDLLVVRYYIPLFFSSITDLPFATLDGELSDINWFRDLFSLVENYLNTVHTRVRSNVV